jgi:hypothetical protein
LWPAPRPQPFTPRLVLPALSLTLTRLPPSPSPLLPPSSSSPPAPPQYYPYVNNNTIDARGLLEQNLQDFGLGKFQWLSGVAKATRLGMRISETNSL